MSDAIASEAQCSSEPSERRAHAPPRQIAALVIEDDPDAREVLADMIECSGYSVMTAANGREAIEMLRTVRPSVIFVDLLMPVMSGAEFRQAQRHNREWLGIPTVVMTASSEEPQLDLAVEQTLHKPIRLEDLLAIVRRHAREPR